MIKNGPLLASLAVLAGALAGVACGIDATGTEVGPNDDAGASDASSSDNSDGGARDASSSDGSDGSDGETASFTLGGSVAGLAGDGLVLENNGDTIAIAKTDASFVFPTKVAAGTSFDVKVKTQPSGPPQQCVVSGGTGTIVAGDVSTVTVNCTTLYTVGGTVAGLAGSGLVLENNAGDPIPLNVNGTFSFPTPAATGTSYAVTIKTNPQTPWQTCEVGNGTGQVATANVSSVTVTCTTDKHTVGGSITGLAGSGLVLQLNGAQNLTRAPGDTAFVFGAMDSGTNYTVSVLTQPTNPPQTCEPSDASGVVGGADVSNVKLACTTNKYKTRVQVTGLSGTGLVLQNNGGDDLVVNASGTREFATSITSGGSYNVTIKTLPTPSGEKCKVSSGSGTIVDHDVDVLVACVRQYTVFTTSTSYDGNLGGLAGADAKCQERADAAGLTGTFKAWLSDGTGSPSTRFTRSADPHVLVDGTVIAANYTELTGGTLQHAIDKTETGGAPPVEPIFGRPVVWTDTWENGNLVWIEHSCVNWTSAVESEIDAAVLGNTTKSTNWSFSNGGTSCARSNALYCFEQ